MINKQEANIILEESINFEKLRKDQLRKINTLYDNIETKQLDDQSKEIKEYVKASKNYQKEYKENIKNMELAK